MTLTRSELGALLRSDLFRYTREPGVRSAWRVVRQQAGFRVSAVYRVARYCELNQHPARRLAFLVQRLSNAVHQCELRHDVSVGPGLRINHVKCLVVASGTVIGPGATLCHEVTLGLSSPDDASSTATLGARVYVAPGARIFGAVVGNDVVVGANTVVTRDVPDGTVVSGSPSRARPLVSPERFQINVDFGATLPGLPPPERC